MTGGLHSLERQVDKARTHIGPSPKLVQHYIHHSVANVGTGGERHRSRNSSLCDCVNHRRYREAREISVGTSTYERPALRAFARFTISALVGQVDSNLF